jgi:hypothetical protein
VVCSSLGLHESKYHPFYYTNVGSDLFQRTDDLVTQTLQLEAALQGSTIFEVTDSEERDEGIESGSSGVENQVK